jgi:RNA polymerase subunit RPABC4/transcription elongation factor Spt4
VKTPVPQFDESAQLDEDAPRCPSCGKRVRAEMTLCPACGYELLPRRARVRCKRCGSRVPADVTVCPRCKGDPRAERFPIVLVRGAAILLGVVALACLGWVLVRALGNNVLGRAFASPTVVRATVIQVIHVVATPIPPTSTQTPTLTATPSGRASPTRRGAATATPAITLTPTLPPGFYPTPQLLAPAHMTVYSGANASILLEWLPVTTGSLRENEWYEVRLLYTARNNTPGEYRHYTKETRWTVRPDWRDDLAPDARQVRWLVTVVRVEGLNPFASSTRTPVSLPSATRVFVWN